jgi:hypothetical protein
MLLATHLAEPRPGPGHAQANLPKNGIDTGRQLCCIVCVMLSDNDAGDVSGMPCGSWS